VKIDPNTQPARNPKAECIPPGLADAPESVRVSAFGLPSGFGLRPSGFGNWLGATRSSLGYMLTEALVYIGLVFVVLGVGYVAMYRCIDSSVALRRNADDILGAVHAGEQWRADIRLAERGVRWDHTGEPFLRLQGATNVVDYRFAGGSVFRRADAGQWSKLLDHVESSTVERDARPTVTVWRWELELQAKAHGSFKSGRVRPLFTFLGVPAGSGSHEN
jgi:hypothetical protein